MRCGLVDKVAATSHQAPCRCFHMRGQLAPQNVTSPAHCRHDLFGELGDGGYSDRATPAAVEGTCTHFNMLSAGWSHTCGVLANSYRVACWGEALGSTCLQACEDGCGCSQPPVGVGSRAPSVQLQADSWCLHACWHNELQCSPSGTALDLHSSHPSLPFSNNVAGYGYHNGLGSGATDRAQPTLIDDGGGSTYTSVSCGYGHTCALRTDDRVLCFGLNSDGECGDPSFKDVPLPTLIGGFFRQIVAGFTHTCGLRKSDGHALCFGAQGGVCMGWMPGSHWGEAAVEDGVGLLDEGASTEASKPLCGWSVCCASWHLQGWSGATT